MAAKFTLWHIPSNGEQSETRLLGEFPAHGKAILGAKPFIPEDAVLSGPWEKEDDESRLEMGEHGTLLVVKAKE